MTKAICGKGHSVDVVHTLDASAANGGGHVLHANHLVNASPTYAIIAALWRQRYAWIKTRTATTLAAQARCRAYALGDKVAASKIWKDYLKGLDTDSHLAITLRPYLAAIKMFDAEIKPVEKHLTKLVKELPCYPYMKAIKGIGDMYIAGVYGECGGPITKSHSVSALWKFFGLAVYDGERQAFSADKAKNARHGYSARRRSLISQIESGFLMSGNAEYRALYEERKAYELARGIAKGHAHNRAKRYCGKRFLRRLYGHARGVEGGQDFHATHILDASLANDLSGHSRDETHLRDAALNATDSHANDLTQTTHAVRGTPLSQAA